MGKCDLRGTFVKEWFEEKGVLGERFSWRGFRETDLRKN